MNVLDLAQQEVKLWKVSATKGGEWHGPCPDCGGQDRFHVWPNENDGKGSYWCRVCEKHGDNIQFLIDFEGMTFREACTRLNIMLPDRLGSRRSAPSQKQRPEFTPEAHGPPADLWQEKAEKFLAWSQGHLAKNDETLAWLANRGVSAVAAENGRLGWNPGEDGKDIYRSRSGWGLPSILKENNKAKALWIPVGLVIPHIVDGIIHRLRIRRPEGEPRYYVIPGSSMSTMVIESERRAFVVVEAELDGIAVASLNQLAGAVALGSVGAKPDTWAYQILRGALQILNALDYGDIGGGAKAAERAMQWWKEQFNRCDRWPVPRGKDPGEAYALGIDLDKWIKAGLPPAMTIEWPATPRDVGPRRVIDRPPEGWGAPSELPCLIRELYDLLRKNPGVKIINTANRYTVLRQGKYVGGRINDLVFQVAETKEYIMSHPAEEIDGENFLCGMNINGQSKINDPERGEGI